ncbi:hypothetical protein [Streptomyces antimycoticus]|uniref:hypothetical protein n=1 Tax=Streptomyces antimycoticus TaxID=68175 RepID=UPI000A37EEEC|nr:hypothetical protein [Streptomyces antimycoticus]
MRTEKSEEREPDGTARRRKWIRRVPAGVVGVAAVSLIALTVSPVNAEPDGRAKPPRGRNPLPAPPQIRDLDFLLGSYTCEYTPPPGGTAAVLKLTTRRALGGHYFYTDATLDPGNVVGRSAFGWNPVDGKFINQYHDNWGSSGNYTSSGWKDGHLIFKGPLTQVITPNATGQTSGVKLDLMDDYQVLGRGHFKNSTSFTFPDGSTLQGSYDCRRQ